MNTAVRLVGYAGVTVLLGAGAYLAGTVVDLPAEAPTPLSGTAPVDPAVPMAEHAPAEDTP